MSSLYNLATTYSGAFGFATGAMASSYLPMSVGVVAAGSIAWAPVFVTAIGHTALVGIEQLDMGLPKGSAKILTPALSVSLAALTFAALTLLGVTTFTGALLIVLPTLITGAILTYYCNTEETSDTEQKSNTERKPSGGYMKYTPEGFEQVEI